MSPYCQILQLDEIALTACQIRAEIDNTNEALGIIGDDADEECEKELDDELDDSEDTWSEQRVLLKSKQRPMQMGELEKQSPNDRLFVRFRSKLAAYLGNRLRALGTVVKAWPSFKPFDLVCSFFVHCS